MSAFLLSFPSVVHCLIFFLSLPGLLSFDLQEAAGGGGGGDTDADAVTTQRVRVLDTQTM